MIYVDTQWYTDIHTQAYIGIREHTLAYTGIRADREAKRISTMAANPIHKRQAGLMVPKKTLWPIVLVSCQIQMSPSCKVFRVHGFRTRLQDLEEPQSEVFRTEPIESYHHSLLCNKCSWLQPVSTNREGKWTYINQNFIVINRNAAKMFHPSARCGPKGSRTDWSSFTCNTAMSESGSAPTT